MTCVAPALEPASTDDAAGTIWRRPSMRVERRHDQRVRIRRGASEPLPRGAPGSRPKTQQPNLRCSARSIAPGSAP
jgi:hypothetical protein